MHTQQRATVPGSVPQWDAGNACGERRRVSGLAGELPTKAEEASGRIPGTATIAAATFQEVVAGVVTFYRVRYDNRFRPAQLTVSCFVTRENAGTDRATLLIGHLAFTADKPTRWRAPSTGSACSGRPGLTSAHGDEPIRRSELGAREPRDRFRPDAWGRGFWLDSRLGKPIDERRLVGADGLDRGNLARGGSAGARRRLARRPQADRAADTAEADLAVDEFELCRGVPTAPEPRVQPSAAGTSADAGDARAGSTSLLR